MPNWVYHRVSLSGPPEDIAEFRAICIGPGRRESTNGTSFDFEGLLPIPEDVAAILDHPFPRAVQTAVAYPAAQDPDMWRLDHWGVKWNACQFSEIAASDDFIDFYFETPWSSPEPVFVALAARFPILLGTVFALEDGHGFGLVGDLRNGTFTACETQACHRLGLLTDDCVRHYSADGFTTQALAAYSHLLRPVTSEKTATAVIDEVWRAYRSDLPVTYLCRQDFVRDLCGYVNWSWQGNPYPPIDEFVHDPANRSLFMTTGWFRTEVDRSLMMDIASHLGAAWNFHSVGFGDWLPWSRRAHQIASEYDENHLLAWATDAILRGVRPVDTSSLDVMRRSFADYAIKVHKHMLAHVEQQQLALHQARMGGNP
jgi:hypothetical protein